jgi:hypothetical protein
MSSYRRNPAMPRATAQPVPRRSPSISKGSIAAGGNSRHASARERLNSAHYWSRRGTGTRNPEPGTRNPEPMFPPPTAHGTREGSRWPRRRRPRSAGC